MESVLKSLFKRELKAILAPESTTKKGIKNIYNR